MSLPCCSFVQPYNPPPSTEVVLSVLLSTFKFELTEKPVHWNLAGIIYPTVGTDPTPTLPMKVSLVQRG